MGSYQGSVLIQMSNGTALELDASLSEGHQTAAEVTDFPVEQGADISDHARLLPAQLRIEGIKSDTPVLTAAELQAIGYAGKVGPGGSFSAGIVDGAYKFLLNLFSVSDLVTIVTKKRTYSNMRILNLSVPDGPGLSDVLDFTANFKEIRVVQNKTVQVATRAPAGQPLVNNGKQNTTQASQAQVNRSALKGVLDFTGLTKKILNAIPGTGGGG